VWETEWRIGTGLDGPGDPSSRGQVRLGYHRAVMLPLCARRAAGLIEGLVHPSEIPAPRDGACGGRPVRRAAHRWRMMWGDISPV